MPKQKQPKKSPKRNDSATDMIQDADFMAFAESHYKRYMMSVVEDRAIPDFRDGMIPVARRVLWSMYKNGLRSNVKSVKSARTVGDTLGKYHPHSDVGTYNAMVNMTNRNSPYPFIHGDGNWGSMTANGNAAMRYTEARLSKIGDVVMFDKFYTPVIETVPNYDGQEEEPLILPALLPVILLTGKEGVAPGASTYIPACTVKSLLSALINAFEERSVDPKALYKTIRFTSTSGGTEIMPIEKEDKLKRMALFTSTRGRVVLGSTYVADETKLKITVTAFANHWKLSSLIEKLSAMDAVKRAEDDTTKNDKYATLVIQIKPSHKKDFAKIVKQIVDKHLTTRENYVLNFTERYIDETGQGQGRMKPMSLVDMLKEWMRYRVDLERRACTYWIGEAAKQIRKLELLIMACDELDFLFKLLKSKADRPEMDAQIAKKFKISKDEAHVITEMKYYQLSRLEKENLQTQIKEIKKNQKELDGRRTKPVPYIVKHLKSVQ